MSQNNKLVMAIVAVNLISSLVASTYLITLQFDAQRRSAIASKERKELKKQYDVLLCTLQTKPESRTPDTINECRSKTVGE